MFPFFKKNSRNYYPMPNYQNINEQNLYEQNMYDLEIKELQRQINNINMRLNRIEGYLGIREQN